MVLSRLHHHGSTIYRPGGAELPAGAGVNGVRPECLPYAGRGPTILAVPECSLQLA